jgi:hypothetical protein
MRDQQRIKRELTELRSRPCYSNLLSRRNLFSKRGFDCAIREAGGPQILEERREIR